MGEDSLVNQGGSDGGKSFGLAATVAGAADRAHAPLLEVRELEVIFPGKDRTEKHVVHGLNYSIARGETLGVVGESGCGKTMTSLALLGLIPGAGRAQGGIYLEGRNLLDQSPQQWRDLRGSDVAMIFQEPMSAMNPVMKVGRQIAEVLITHENMPAKAAEGRAVELLDAVGIPSAAQRAQDYPHQLSGGMRQRAMIAMALACRPKLLIADEPTTALDVTIQAQILDLILELQADTGMAVQFISHNLAVVSEVAHRILVMYAGRGVEMAPADTIFAKPLHPYTQGLIATLPTPETKVERLYEIPGSLRFQPNQGCRFASRCPFVSDICREDEPEFREIEPGHFVACVKAAA